MTLPDEGDKPEFLQKALVRFLVNVAHLNIFTPKDEKNYCMLVHTSGLRGEHAVDKEVVEKFFAEIEDKSHKNFHKRYAQIHKDASERYKVDPDEIVKSEEQLALEQQQQAALQAQMQQGAIASGNEALNEPRMAPPQGAF